MSKLFHLPLTIFWAPVCTGNSLSFELNAAGGLPEIFCSWELSLDTHCRVVRRKFKQRLHDQTQKRVQDIMGHSALLICHLTQCSPGAWERFNGGKNQNELCRVYPYGYFIPALSQKLYVLYSLVTLEFTWEGSSEGYEGQRKLQKWLPYVGMILTLPFPTSGTRE